MRWNGDSGGVEGKGGVNGWVGGVMGLEGGVGGSRIRSIGICTCVGGLGNGFGGVHGGWAGVRVGGGEEGWKVLLGRNIKWGGIFYLVVREGRGDYTVRAGTLPARFTDLVLQLRKIRNSTGTWLGHVIHVLLLGAFARLHMTLELERSFDEILNLLQTNCFLKLGIPLNVETCSVRIQTSG